MPNYTLTQRKGAKTEAKSFANMRKSIRGFGIYLKGEGLVITIAIISVFVNIGSTILTPYLISQSIDRYISKGDFNGLSVVIFALVGIYLVNFVASYLQSRLMGRLSQRTLFRLRETLFAKIQSLPMLFFNQNQTGDLISRLNNDTDKVNQFLSQAFLRFISVFLSVIGIAVVTLFINWQMALVMITSSVIIFVINVFFSDYIQRVNKQSLAALGNFSSQVDENLSNFKVIVAFHHQDYFKQKLGQANNENFKKATKAQVLTGIFSPVYTFAGNIAQVLVLLFGVHLISQGQLTFGLLVGFISYTQQFYSPLQILGSIWGSLQETISAWSRIQEILSVESDLTVINKK